MIRSSEFIHIGMIKIDTMNAAAPPPFMFVRISASGYAMTRHSAVAIRDRISERSSAFSRSGVPISSMLFQVNAPVLSVSP